MLRWIPLLLLAVGVTAQERPDPWSRMQRHDADGDGKVSREEFPGPDRMFDRLDGDADGFVTKDEAAAMRGRRGGGRGGAGGGAAMARRFDADQDGRITQAEWDAFFEKADENGDGLLDAGEMTAALRGRAYNDTAPKVGDAAPAVKAKRADDGSEVNLARIDRPTVLVFGSWT